MPEDIPWNKLNGAAERHLRPGLPARVLAAAAQHRAAAVELYDALRGMAVGGLAIAVLTFAGIETHARLVAPVRLAQWDQVADWVGYFDR
jgi:hypothetical protein